MTTNATTTNATTTNATTTNPSAEIADRYRTLSKRFTDLVDAVPADRWDAASPCEEWTAKDVFAHVVGTESDLLGRMPFGTTSAVDGLDTRAAWDVVRTQVQSALDDPELAGHTYDSMFGPTTFAQTVDQFYSLDLVVHAWDLATATGVDEFQEMPADEVRTVSEALTPIAATMRQPGVFGPEVAVPDDADPQTRLLGLIGRPAGRSVG